MTLSYRKLQYSNYFKDMNNFSSKHYFSHFELQNSLGGGSLESLHATFRH